MHSAHQTGTLHSGDVEIFYRKFGASGKTPLVIVHGLSFMSWDWIDVAAALATDREVAAMDMRGFGESTWSPGKDYSVPTMGGDLAALIRHLGWSQAILVGHSMGARGVAWCAANHPAPVRAAVLLDYSPENAPAGSKRTTERVGRQPDVFEDVDAAMRYHGEDPASESGKKRRARFEAFLRPVEGGMQLKRDVYFRDQFKRVLDTGEKPKLGIDMWQVLAEIACPTLVIRGAQSDMFAAETVGRVKAANARLHVVEIRGGHNVAGDNPQGFVASVREFLNTLEERHVKAA
ncbi:MAG: alpha/beta hydrolase [Betaproteobacteria bacterium]|nr:alpha/beta hydrolase [Betaproteobacteria bacterium]